MYADADPWRCLAEQQQGIVSRSQLLSLGLSRSQARRNVANGRWRLLLPGVYATFTGPVGGWPRSGQLYWAQDPARPRATPQRCGSAASLTIALM